MYVILKELSVALTIIISCFGRDIPEKRLNNGYSRVKRIVRQGKQMKGFQFPINFEQNLQQLKVRKRKKIKSCKNFLERGRKII